MTGQQNSQPTDEIEVLVGAKFNLTLTELPTAGYEWRFEFDPDQLTLVESSFAPADEAVGSGGTRTVTFQSLESGIANVDAELCRPWDRKDVAEFRSFRITARDGHPC